jgi:hypothetical protein
VGLLQRTRARVLQERAAAADRRWQSLVLGLLVLFSWCLGAASWLLVHEVTNGVWMVLGANLADAGTWSLVSVLLVWPTAGVAAVALGKQIEWVRRPL